MPRWKLTLEYDGRPFVGWQRQANGPSVQLALEQAVLRFSGATVTVQGAGRTDARVHALAQVAHFDLDKPTTADVVRNALNFYLRPWPVAVLLVESVADDFHARFSALGRSYLYRIINRCTPLALETGRAWHIPYPLDAVAMHEAARRLIGRHDFSTFRASACQGKSPVKSLERLEVSRTGEAITIVAGARSFLHHQVRNMVGTLALVGRGSWSADDVQVALEARDRSRGGPTAPPDGLYFTGVEYPQSH
ncbi:tRNA pseudouridine synthase A [uncultured Gammaproteobacteria bacterium]